MSSRERAVIPGSSGGPAPEPTYDADERVRLLAVARRSIDHGFSAGAPLVIDLARAPDALTRRRATFTTLRRRGELRGCMGSLEATRPLIQDVADSAFRAAFSDPRFPPLERGEVRDLEIHLAVLAPVEPFPVHSEAELLARLRRGVDGLILEEGRRRSTFLPAVWESLVDPRAFVAALKEKAGLPRDYWSDSLRVSRYTVESIE